MARRPILDPLRFRDADDFTAWRTDRGWTTRGLAAELDVSRATIDRWAAGENEISKAMRLALAHLDCRAETTS